MACKKLTAGISVSTITLFPVKAEILMRSLNLILSLPFKKSTCVSLRKATKYFQSTFKKKVKASIACQHIFHSNSAITNGLIVG